MSILLKMNNKLPKDYFLHPDVVYLSKDLLGKVLCTNINGEYTSGIITETEAYAGVEDKASHAYGGRFTERTKTMYEEGGVSYVYLCYGIHHLFNIVTNKKGIPHAVLIRAVEPLDGLDIILKRRNASKNNKKLLIGPGKVSQGLGITTRLNNIPLTGNVIWLEDRGIKPGKIQTGKRIGVEYAGEDASLPYRFWSHEY